MTSNSKTLSIRPPARHTRALALLLLAFITYTATAGATHKHGTLPPPGRVQTAASFAGSGDSSSTSKDSNTNGECLVCRLHQHLFTSLLNTQPHLVPPTQTVLRAPQTAIADISLADAPRRGRAPPLFSF